VNFHITSTLLSKTIMYILSILHLMYRDIVGKQKCFIGYS